MTKRTRIQKLALVLLAIDTVFLVLIALVAVLTVIQALMGPNQLIEGFQPEFVFPENTPLSKIIISIVMMMAMVGAILYTLWQMRKLFARYAKGESLTTGCAEAIRKTGIGLVWIVILDTFMMPVQSYVISSIISPEDVSVEVDISAASIGLLLAGGLIVLVGWVMREAVDVAEENARFV